jgi:hypothetical protein
MWGLLVVSMLMGGFRLVRCVVLSLLAVVRERERVRTLTAVLRAAEPGSSVLDHRPDGSILMAHVAGR